MAWMFNEGNRGSKRRFLSFIDCIISGPWDLTTEYITSSEVTRVYRALNENACKIDITTSNGDKLQLRFKNAGLVSIEQSMLLFKEEDVAEQNRL